MEEAQLAVKLGDAAHEFGNRFPCSCIFSSHFLQMISIFFPSIITSPRLNSIIFMARSKLKNK